MLLYACTIFLSAFLLFQVQPLIAKMILPWFGGSAAVWTACVLFFQLLLLLGYLYAHWSIRYLRPKSQAILHGALLVVSMLMLPAIPNPAWKPTGGEDPTLRILGLLAATIGLPYFLLSTTGPLVQAWFVREQLKPGSTPYRLYALSNLGSMLALLSYPVLVEPYFATQTQGYGWSAGYVAFVAFCGFTAWRGVAQADSLPSTGHAITLPDPTLMVTWVLLAACASTLLLAITNHLSQNVAAIPFLWVLPLALYLLSFILCFDGDGWYRRHLYLGLFAASIGSMVYALFTDSENMPLKLALPLFGVGMFACCMVCHGELARLKPDPRHLTLFYLMVSIGGAIGGIFVGLIAPRVFSGYYELPLALVFTTALIVSVLRRDLLAGSPYSPLWLASIVCVLGLAGYVGYSMKLARGGYRVAVRNFYGGLRVGDAGTGKSAVRTLTHGTINHGEEYLDPDRRRMPTTYYGPHSGVALAIKNIGDGPRRIGVIGLGTGTIAAHGRPGDSVLYYEINPLVIGIARTEFFYLRDCEAKLDIVLGDARLSLEREPNEDFDVLAVDAFSSDSIPIHLLTMEAFQLYFRHLKPTGILAVHVSNKYLELKPIVGLAAQALGKETRVIDTDDEDDINEFGSTWVLVGGDHEFFQKPAIALGGSKLLARNDLRLWTDNYSNLFRILK